MADYSKFYDARKVVSRILEQDFIGPVTKDECLAELPVQYYIWASYIHKKILWKPWILREIRCLKMKLRPMMHQFL